MDAAFILNSMALGFGLAMDAFCVSMANGLNEPRMSGKKRAGIAGMFGGFQFLMPMAGWFCVHTIASFFSAFQKFIPWIALILLVYIGAGMLRDGVKPRGSRRKEGAAEAAVTSDNSGMEEDQAPHILSLSELLLQAVATSIDALSVGFTLAEYDALTAVCASLLILAVTFAVCYIGLLIGRKFGTMLAGKASILGGIILIAIGLEIFISGVAGNIKL